MSKRTEDLFARFQGIYGARWAACHATEQSVDLAIAEWAEIVDRMTNEQLLDAIDWAKTSSPWPPSIAEFLHAGLGIDELEIRQRAIRLMRRSEMPCVTYRELDAAAKVGRTRAIQSLVEDGLRPAIEQPRQPALGRPRRQSPRRLGLVERL